MTLTCTKLLVVMKSDFCICWGMLSVKGMSKLNNFRNYKLVRNWSVAMICMLFASTAAAASYSIAEGYGNDPNGVCRSVQKSFAEGLVLDAEAPLCERRFRLSPKAGALGLLDINKTLLPAAVYPDLLRKIIPVIGQEKIPQSTFDHKKDEKIITQHIKNADVKIYESNFDPSNDGKVRDVYLLDIMSCSDKGSYWDGSVTTFIKNRDGSIDRQWGVLDATAGIPFIYREHTYYLKWTSLAGSVDKRMLAQLDIYDSVPYSTAQHDTSSHASLTPSYCKIFQSE